MSHTREPWKTSDTNAYGSIIRAHMGMIVLDCNGDCGSNEDRANAERIVACVNACAGMANPSKEIAELREIAAMYKGLCK